MEGNSFLGMSDAFGLDGPNVRGSPKDSWLQIDSLDKAPQQAVRTKCWCCKDELRKCNDQLLSLLLDFHLLHTMISPSRIDLP